MTEYRRLIVDFESETFGLTLEGYRRFESYRLIDFWLDFYKHRANGNLISVVLDFPKKVLTLRKNGKIIKESYG